MSQSSWQKSAEANSIPVHRILEVLTVLLLGAATVGSAWCAYEVSQWNRVETDFARGRGGQVEWIAGVRAGDAEGRLRRDRCHAVRAGVPRR